MSTLFNIQVIDQLRTKSLYQEGMTVRLQEDLLDHLTKDLLALSSRTVDEYVDEGRLSAKRAADVIMIQLDDVRNFKRGTSGRPRKSIPPWRISSCDNIQFSTLILVSIRPGQDTAFLQKLEDMKQHKQHSFPGTIVRYIIRSESFPGQVQILLVWRNTVMPDEQTRARALEQFRQELDDVLDWTTAQYNTGTRKLDRLMR